MQPIVISLGDPAGVGPEIVAKAWALRRERDLPPFFAVGDSASIRAVWDGPITLIDAADKAPAAFDSALPVWHIEDSGDAGPGNPLAEVGHGQPCAPVAPDGRLGEDFAVSGVAGEVGHSWSS